MPPSMRCSRIWRPRLYPLTKGWTLDLVEAVAGHKAAQDALLTDKPAYKRTMIRTAILLAHPVKASGQSDPQTHDATSHHIRMDLVRRHRGRKHGHVRYGDEVGHGLEAGPTGRPP
ncbi:hypothetical protein ACRAWG_31665 [Methylobacterium sp. P31]